jgi:hypothetical protein
LISDQQETGQAAHRSQAFVEQVAAQHAAANPSFRRTTQGQSPRPMR